ncbi:SpoIIE family protein phosphatase [Thalassobaculum sp. OXR-137]|uniref:SpoIIE family protein phosphatase n=1 Tax=Thalassobaculum sp. OXR-137 TaxID=3100173 RepID=UPI002AC9428A|nr:SpoIIE family protein phosphatase [Thalassobaculum sp. OXR-137]WPZ33900.1 SpoIIE family protein phosphatase [Thalassobaculum sp. OXR-137]
MTHASENSKEATTGRMRPARRYSFVMGLAYVVLLAVSVGFFMFQIDKREKAEWDALSSGLKEHGLILDALASAVVRRSEEIRDDVTSAYAAALSDMPDGRVQALVDRGEFGELSLRVNSGIDLPSTAALAGVLDAGADRSTDAELVAALQLLGEFRYLVSLLPTIKRTAYISRAGFAAMLPATQAEADAFLHAPRSDALMTTGLPNDNPERQGRWLFGTDRTGSPLLHLVIPVDVQGRFLGVIAFEFSLDYLNRVNGDFEYPVGQTLLVTADGLLLAHPEQGAIRVPLGSPVADALPVDAAEVVARADDVPSRRVVDVGGTLLYVEALESAPWTLIYLGDRWTILTSLIVDRGPEMLALVAVLTLMMLIAGGLTGREFVWPASQLVEHIKAAGEVGPGGLPRVPPGWRPWFRTVTRVFRENSDLVRLRQELQIAHDMQASVLPREPFRHDRMVIVGQMHAAYEVGGDFYDYFQIDENRVGVVIADVSGKGVPAGLFMMISRTLLRAEGLGGGDPGECLTRVNNLLERENEAAMFVTVFYGVIDLKSLTLSYANAGHNPPFVLKADGSVVPIEPLGDLVLGVMPGIEYSSATTSLSPQDALFLYTDGLTEAFDVNNQEYKEARLIEALATCRGQSAAEIGDSCIADVETFATGAAQADDMTCLVVRIEA